MTVAKRQISPFNKFVASALQPSSKSCVTALKILCITLKEKRNSAETSYKYNHNNSFNVFNRKTVSWKTQWLTLS
jgi:hypothetical protein